MLPYGSGRLAAASPAFVAYEVKGDHHHGQYGSSEQQRQPQYYSWMSSSYDGYSGGRSSAGSSSEELDLELRLLLHPPHTISSNAAKIEETSSARVLRLIPCIAPAVPDTPGFYGDEDRYFFCRWDTEPECSGVGCYDYIENDVLKTEQIVQVGHGARGDVTILPTLVINNMQYRDLFCYDYNGEPSECGGVEDECFRDGAMDEQLLELSMPTPASARRSAR
ncbi:hypothetical protein OsJ_00991 [Oryza sativa Japonica Group]|uniref:Vacuolar sorting receptor thioredoxin-like domain-containing protein n=1 Tax=Oryza sativa subsp. japonica TaxID=39947 RepID=B9EUI2_ORYSJ|nr:hypothetical protein OsJ_00991 [Oryza sativa Japonica Group]